MHLKRIVWIAVVFVLIGAPAAESAVIWIEGEKPTSHKMNRHPWWYDKVKREHLSAGDWISNFAKGKEGVASYKFTAPTSGKYDFWVRANPIATKLSYRFDAKGPWRLIDMSQAIQKANIAADGKPDLRFVSWVPVGEITLKKGAVSVSFRMHSDNSNHGALDAFVLSTDKFAPQGAAKPGANSTPTETVSNKTTWAFKPAADKFTNDALLDLRYLNEKIAGQSGFVQRTKDGNDFALGDGTPVRFWAVGSNVYRKTPAEMDRHARFLAKLGVNMVRMHASLYSKSKTSKITDVNDKEIDGIQRMVAALKKQGIYSTISPFWAHVTAPPSWGIDGYANAQPWGLLFFNEKLQTGYKAWVKELYTRKSPYTGVALKDEPAVAIIQIKNEDSLLFWTMQGIRGPQKKLLGAKFAQWLIKKYGSLDKAKLAWKGAGHKDDNFAERVVGIYIIWEMTRPQKGGKALRINDETQFLSETMHSFYKEIADYHRKTLGCRQIINPMNWTSADPVLLNDAERWSQTACEVIAVNKYYGGVHTGENSGWRIEPGDRITNESALHNPERIPTCLKQVVGHPMLITESTWVPPLLYQSEGPLLIAAYQSLTGVDAFYWFNMTAATWQTDPRFPWAKVRGRNPLYKWSSSTPSILGGFPANALLFRKGYLKQGRTVVHEERSLDNLWRRKVPIISEAGTFDPNRNKGDYAPESTIKQEVDRLAFLVGPVEVKYDGDPAKNKAANLTPYINRKKKVVKSITGQIELDYATGLCKVDAPKAQGVTGFLKAAGGKIKLSDVTIESGNDYAAVTVVPLDDKPIASSKKLLVQIGTTQRMTGWADRKINFKSKDGKKTFSGREIVSVGAPPWRIANTQATITVTNPHLTQAALLDTAGHAAAKVDVKRTGAKLTVKCPQTTIWLILSK
ncbi:MAG: hypothetical protein HN350_17540 [Phycisphaerales bacterium]|jgi:hypothetical protein|nr:hypothetical protein [Phycisphaerales bacterium]